MAPTGAGGRGGAAVLLILGSDVCGMVIDRVDGSVV